jgi:hypothetical protein
MPISIWNVIGESASQPFLNRERYALYREATQIKEGLDYYEQDKHQEAIEERLRNLGMVSPREEGLIPVRFIGITVGVRAYSLELAIDGRVSSGFQFSAEEKHHIESAQDRSLRAVQEDGLTSAPFSLIQAELAHTALTDSNTPMKYAELIGHAIGIRSGLLSAASA